MNPSAQACPKFATTRWTVVLAASDKDSPDASAALETLCRTYWQPLYAFARSKGVDPHEAQDLTQLFFTKIFLGKNLFAAADRNRGKFRTFLLTAMRRFLVNEREAALSQKRGGDCVLIPLDTADAEARYLAEPAATSAELAFEKEWARTLLERTFARLREDYEKSGMVSVYETLKPCLAASHGEIAYADLAAELDMHEGAVRTAVSRLRRRFREALRETVADTVEDVGEVDGEIRHVMDAFGTL